MDPDLGASVWKENINQIFSPDASPEPLGVSLLWFKQLVFGSHIISGNSISNYILVLLTIIHLRV